MLAASDWGLGWVIFDAKEFLNADLMLASLAVIGAIGFVFERLVFGSLERATVLRWGMVRAAKGLDREIRRIPGFAQEPRIEYLSLTRATH